VDGCGDESNHEAASISSGGLPSSPSREEENDQTSQADDCVCQEFACRPHGQRVDSTSAPRSRVPGGLPADGKVPLIDTGRIFCQVPGIDCSEFCRKYLQFCFWSVPGCQCLCGFAGEKYPQYLSFDTRAARRCQNRVPLLDGHGLGEIAGLVYVAAAANGDVVGEQLKGDDLDERG
jgi:hypothetical protein